MQVIFTEDVDKNYKNDIKNVKKGYARHLMRYDKAVFATPELIKIAEEKQAERLAKLKQQQAEAEELIVQLEEITLEFTEKTNDEGHLFGSITETHIAEQLSEKSGKEIEKDKIGLGEHLKEVGEYQVNINLIKGVRSAKITVTVKGEE